MKMQVEKNPCRICSPALTAAKSSRFFITFNLKQDLLGLAGAWWVAKPGRSYLPQHIKHA